jgi:hypothetical protein
LTYLAINKCVSSGRPLTSELAYDYEDIPFILINKSNMTTLEHFATAQKLADRLYPRQDFSNWIIIKNETIVVDLSSLKHLTAMPIEFHRRLETLLNER